MHSKLWKITKMLLAVLVLLTVNIGCAPVQGEDKMTHVEWSTFLYEPEPSVPHPVLQV